DLITEAKRLGLKGYSRLRKLDLLELIKGSSNKVRSILNQTFPDIDAPRREIEEMLGLRRPGLTETEMGDKRKDFVKGYTPSTLPHRFVAIESAIILTGFLRQFQIKGVGAYNHERCMEKAKPEFLRLMGKNREKKVKQIDPD
ncbi:unnamed protein product, partial [Pocillopora meandrina]